jgi:hypothetical protein
LSAQVALTLPERQNGGSVRNLRASPGR